MLSTSSVCIRPKRHRFEVDSSDDRRVSSLLKARFFKKYIITYRMQSVLQCCGFKKLHLYFIVMLSLLKLYFFLPQFHALSSLLVRHVLHFHVRHFHVLQFPVLQIMVRHFTSCYFTPCTLVHQFHALQFSWSVIFTSSIFSQHYKFSGSVTLVLLPLSLKYEIDDSVAMTVVLLGEAGCGTLMGGT